jgi:peptide/nickel transport system substrate-binding protein
MAIANMTKSLDPRGITGAIQKYPGTLLVLLILALVQGNCSSDLSLSNAPASVALPGEIPAGALEVFCQGRLGGGLRYALAGEPNTFNYLAATESRSRLLAFLTTGTVLEFDPVSQVVKPGVCSATYGPDRTSVRLALREGLRFSDGVAVSPDDVVFTLEKILDESSSNVLRDSLLIYDEPVKFSVLPSGEVELRWSRPFAGIESVLAAIPVLPRHLLESGGREVRIEEQWTLGTPVSEMAGLGAFTIADHQPGISTTLTRNSYYWKVDSRGTQLPYLDEVTFLYLEDRNSQVLRLSLGQLDFVDQLLRPEDFKLLDAQGTCVTRELGPSNNVTFFWLNLNKPQTEEAKLKYSWFSKREFRQAVSAVVSRSSIARNIYLGLATEAKGLISPANSRWFATVQTPPSGIDAARELLSQAGFSYVGTDSGTRLVDSSGTPVRFELVTTSDDVQSRIASLLRQDLAQIGMEVTVRQEELRSVISRVMGSRDYDAAMMNQELPLEPLDMRDLLLSGGGMHFWRIDGSAAADWETEIDRLMDELSLSMDRERQVELFGRVQQILARERPVIPLVHRDILLARASSLAEMDVAAVFPYAWARAWKISRIER